MEEVNYSIKRVLLIPKTDEVKFYNDRFGRQLFMSMCEQGIIDKNHARENSDEHKRTLETVEALLKQNNINYEKVSQSDLEIEKFEKEWDLIIPVGGDGTLLYVAGFIQNDTPVLGVKSSAKSVGAHLFTDATNIQEHLDRLVSGNYHIEKQSRLEGLIPKGTFTIKDLALNDIAVGDLHFSGMGKVEIHYDNAIYNTAGSAIVATTYKGKTGWYDNFMVPERNESKTGTLKKALLAAGFDEDYINNLKFSCPESEYLEGEETLIRYKVMAGRSNKEHKSEGYDYGIIPVGKELIIVSKSVTGVYAAFDGGTPDKPGKRFYEIPFGGSITIKMSDKPLSVVKFN